MSVFMNIKHDEFEGQDTYRGVKVSRLVSGQIREDEKVFFTGDVVEDWNEAITYARELHKNDESGYDRILTSSDVDHFLGEEPQAFDFDDNGFMYRVQKESV